jgi:hypothetical protein
MYGSPSKGFLNTSAEVFFRLRSNEKYFDKDVSYYLGPETPWGFDNLRTSGIGNCLGGKFQISYLFPVSQSDWFVGMGVLARFWDTEPRHIHGTRSYYFDGSTGDIRTQYFDLRDRVQEWQLGPVLRCQAVMPTSKRLVFMVSGGLVHP